MSTAAQSAPPPLKQRVITNTLAQMVGPAVRAVLGLAVTGILTRYLGITNYGEYILIFAYVTLVGGIFMDWGISTVVIREISQNPRARSAVIVSAAALQGVVAVISYLALLLGVVLFRYPETVKLGAAVWGIVLLTSAPDVLSLTFYADLQMRRLIGPQTVGTVVSAMLAVACVLAHLGVVALCAAALAGRLVQLAWTVRAVLSREHFSWRPDIHRWPALARESWPLGLNTILSAAVLQAPYIVLAKVGFDQVGLFGAAAKIPAQLGVLALLLRMSFFPVLASSWTQDRDRFARQLRDLLAAAMLVVLPVGFLAIGTATFVMGLIVGSHSAAAVPAYRWLTVMLIVLVPGWFVGEALVAAGKQKLNLWISALVLPVSVVLLLVLAGPLGATGAAAAVAMSYGLLTVATLVVAKRQDVFAVPGLTIVMALLAAAVGAFVVTSRPVVNEFINGALAAVAAAFPMLLVHRKLTRDLVRSIFRAGRM